MFTVPRPLQYRYLVWLIQIHQLPRDAIVEVGVITAFTSRMLSLVVMVIGSLTFLILESILTLKYFACYSSQNWLNDIQERDGWIHGIPRIYKCRTCIRWSRYKMRIVIINPSYYYAHSLVLGLRVCSVGSSCSEKQAFWIASLRALPSLPFSRKARFRLSFFVGDCLSSLIFKSLFLLLEGKSIELLLVEFIVL